MSDLFYWSAVIFIFEFIRGIFMVSKEIDDYVPGTKFPVNNPDKIKESIGSLMGSIKSKAIPSIIGLLFFVWNIIGIFNTDEWLWFSINMGIMIGFTGLSEKIKKAPVIVSLNIISSLIMGYILYLHF